MNRKLAYQLITLLLLAMALPYNLLLADDTAGNTPPIQTEVELIYDSKKHYFNQGGRKTEQGEKNLKFAKKVAKLAKKKYAELSMYLPVPIERLSDSHLIIRFAPNVDDRTMADIYNNEIRLYDNYMNKPENERAVGLVVHEISHVLQTPYRDYTPAWMMEAMAEFFRYNYQEEQHVYYSMARTKITLLKLDKNITDLREKLEGGDLSVARDLTLAERKKEQFWDVGYKENPKDPVHSAGLYSLINDEYLQKQNRNFKVIINSTETGTGSDADGYADKRHNMTVETKSKKYLGKVYYVSTLIDTNGKTTYEVDTKVNQNSTETYKITTVEDRVKKKEGEKTAEDNRLFETPYDSFVYQLNKEIYNRKRDRKNFQSSEMSAFVSELTGNDLDSLWREYLNRAYASHVPFLDNIHVKVLVRGDNEEISVANLSARRAIQAIYIQTEDERAYEIKYKSHSFVLPYILRAWNYVPSIDY